MPIDIDQFMCRSDNFGVLVRDRETGETALIDAPEEGPILDAVERTGWTPTMILTTHHHGDHVEANLALKNRFGLRIVGPAKEASRIPGIDETVDGGSIFKLGAREVHVLSTPGHTLGHISYHIPGAKTLFCADTLFSLGCGRPLEGDAEMMWRSLQTLAALPPETVFYCGHEYTQSNARFALTIDPENPALRERAAEVDRLREDGMPTLPSTIGSELAANPFLRPNDPAIRRRLGMEGASDVEVFAEIRRRKDRF
ncbi:hydroxyacylglutathione hydrolase [Pseudaminobacter sp. 19-2017]|uniref:Hydroxyacylglutathione hydrolase n=1 Tax=Pseudaminobacter soli (ex Zhang et al. 2022) TaxID=2831468 RepID=A0A942I754_9HYPH|nr:hydroxyacylglutathione hydrolase [Pseudaminobacter soli]MBS3648035.1 hydroxyacylglutathione hydrolase [Pseudaminobacter soli]